MPLFDFGSCSGELVIVSNQVHRCLNFCDYIGWDSRIKWTAVAANDVIETANVKGLYNRCVIILSAITEADLLEWRDNLLHLSCCRMIASSLGVVDFVSNLGANDGGAGRMSFGANFGCVCAAVADTPYDHPIFADAVQERFHIFHAATDLYAHKGR